METDSNSFNGEIIQKLRPGYKIPLKTCKESAESPQDKQNETIYSSPLLNEPDIKPTTQCLPSPRKRKTSDADKFIYGRDKSYPPELNFLIQPLHCNLCTVNMNSIKTSKDHYESKAHDKKVVTWLSEWCKKTGEPIPKVQRLIKDGPSGPNAFHCESCDLPLTSIQHAKQHYSGKRHKLVVSNLANPSGSGFYNRDGKWQRQNVKPCTDTTTRFGIGELFLKSDNNTTSEAKESPEEDPSTFCDLCKIKVTSDQQMVMHLQGTKHAKKLKSLGKPPYAPPGDTILASMQTGIPQNNQNDISMYRTPSGNYYCMTCNLTFSDSSVFLQHLDSKKHLNNSKKTDAAAVSKGVT